MPLHIEMEKTGEVAVLQCRGRIVRAESLSTLKDTVTRLLRVRVIVLDLSGAEMLDCGGLGMLVFLHNWTSANGIQLKLVNPSKLVREMLRRTGLASVLHISSVEDLIEIFCNSEPATTSIDRAITQSIFDEQSVLGPM